MTEKTGVPFDPEPEGMYTKDCTGVQSAMGKENLEREYKGKLIRAVNLPEEYADLKEWIGRMKFGWRNVMAVIRPSVTVLYWFTPDSIISVIVKLPGKGTEGYLGGGASKRMPRAGEKHTRGNDLADGPYTEETWYRIIEDAAGWSIEPLEIEYALDISGGPVTETEE